MTLQATLTLDRVYIAAVSNLSDYIQCGSAGSVGGGGQQTLTQTVDGGYREYANNRVRSITGTTTVTQRTITLRNLTATQVKKITVTWLGQTVLLRDTYGRKMFGTYQTTSETPIPLSGGFTDVAITLTQVYYSEAV